jgi:hypothetical protein
MIAALPLIVATLLADGPAPAAKVAYYLGESTVRNADGKALGNLVVLLKRELRPGEARIVETTLLLSSRAGEPVQEHVTISTVKGGSFALKERKGTFSGDGTLTGPAWAWTSWTTNTTLAGGGGTLRARNQLTDRGMAVDKTLLAPNGAVRATFTEDHASIDGATYELLRTKLLPAEGPR